MSLTLPTGSVNPSIGHNIHSIGIVGDGSTDVTTQFQAAIDSVASGGLLLVPAGTYIVSGLTRTSPITIVGEGEGTIIKLKNSSNSYIFNLTGVTNMYDLMLDGNKTNNTSGGCITMSAGSDFSTFTNVLIFRGKDTGVTISGPNQVSFISCRIMQNTVGASITNGVCVNFTNGTTIEDNGTHGIKVIGTSNNCSVGVRDCYFEDNDADGPGTAYHIECSSMQAGQLGNTGNTSLHVTNCYFNCTTGSNSHCGIKFAGAGVQGNRVMSSHFNNLDSNAFEFGTITARGLNDLRGNQYDNTTSHTVGSTSLGFLFDDAIIETIHSQEFDLSGSSTTQVYRPSAGMKNYYVDQASVIYTEATSADTGVALKIGITGAAGQFLNFTSDTGESANAVLDKTSDLNGYVSSSHEYSSTSGSDKGIVFACDGGKTGTGVAILSARLITH